MTFLNEQGLTRLWGHILAKLGGKVDKVDGKGLSTNDYTNEEKEKVSNSLNGVNNLKILVGETAVSVQINNALADFIIDGGNWE